MRQVVFDRYGGPEALRIEETPIPQPRANEILVRVAAVGLNASDWETLTGSPAYVRVGGVFRPRNHTLGSDVSGWVESVGPGVTRFKPGDEVFADLLDTRGGLADYVRGPARAFALKPVEVSHEVAATLPQAGVIALLGIRDKGRVAAGQRVAINGAGGGAGILAVQLAKAAGAFVAAIDRNEKLPVLRSLGADEFIAYQREDFTARGERYDLILDLVARRPLLAHRRALTDRGRYFYVGGSVRTLLQAATLGPLLAAGGGPRMGILIARSSTALLDRLGTMAARAEITPHIHRRYRLEEAAEALRALGAGEVIGKAVILSEVQGIAAGR